ncbi:MAG: protein kinase [Verrucomicrobiaceae bacterium]
MHGLLAAGAQTRPAHDWQPPSVEQLQAALPQYEISEFIARGGMGAVYKGMQTALKRPVAIKVLPPEADSGDLQFAERFKREAQAMARLSHPNIVAVHDAGQTAGGLLYFVMEYVEGTDVAQLIASEGRISTRKAAQIITAVCDALAFAHEEGIIHRDIKPSNIMIDRKGRVKVADFGLAKSVHVESTMITRSDMAMGTPDFVAPEALIPGMSVDQRADLYAVGVMLYQMLTGRVPRGRFDPPSQVVPKMDKSLDAIVDKAMQTDRDKRYSTATELKRDVEKVAAKVMKGGREDTLARAKKGSSQGSAGTPARPSSPGGEAAKHEAGKSARAPLLAAAAVIFLGLGAWFVMGKKSGKDTASDAAQGAAATAGGTEPKKSFFPLPMAQRPAQSGKVVMWRLDGQPVDPNDPEAKLPPGLDEVVMLASGSGQTGGADPDKTARHLLALKSDGSVVAWGGNGDGVSLVPSGMRDVVSIAACGDLSATLDAKGRLMAWGKTDYLRSLPPLSEKVVQIDGRKWHMAALTESGKIYHFGAVGGSQTIPMLPHNQTPVALDGRAVQLTVAGDWLAALRDDGRLFVWGGMSSKNSNGTKPIAQNEWDWPGDPATKRVRVAPGKVPRLFTHNSMTDIYVEGFEGFPLRLAADLPDHLIKDSRYLESRKMNLSGLETFVFDDPATAFKLHGRWHFDNIGKTTEKTQGNVLYCEQQAQGCIQLVFTRRHAFGIKPGGQSGISPSTNP